jgi:hypothetical protein
MYGPWIAELLAVLKVASRVLDLGCGCGGPVAVVALYSMIHMPLTEQPALLRSVASWLVEDGLRLVSAGWSAWTGSDDGWLGSETPMWWSHADVATYRQWLTEVLHGAPPRIRSGRRRRPQPVLATTDDTASPRGQPTRTAIPG